MTNEFTVGETVRVVALPPYIKTAEPMPMLRPPDTIRVGEEGTVIDRRPGGYWVIRFERGTFLLDSQYIEGVTPEPEPEPEPPPASHLEQTFPADSHPSDG
jgi:hypothetical protein